MECITGDTIDISYWTGFGYYDFTQYWDKQESEENLKIGRWLGVSHRVCSALCYWILAAKSKVIAGKTVQQVTKDESATDDFQRVIWHNNNCLAKSFGKGDYYASNLYGIEWFTNDDVLNS